MKEPIFNRIGPDDFQLLQIVPKQNQTFFYFQATNKNPLVEKLTLLAHNKGYEILIQTRDHQGLVGFLNKIKIPLQFNKNLFVHLNGYTDFIERENEIALKIMLILGLTPDDFITSNKP